MHFFCSNSGKYPDCLICPVSCKYSGIYIPIGSSSIYYVLDNQLHEIKINMGDFKTQEEQVLSEIVDSAIKTANVFMGKMSGTKSDICPACNGLKVQKRDLDGLKVICPVCNGSGTFKIDDKN